MDAFVSRLWQDASARWDDLRAFVGFGDALAGLPPWLAPPLALASLLALVALAGLSLAALAVLLTALLAAHLLLERVFGVTLGVAMPAA